MPGFAIRCWPALSAEPADLALQKTHRFRFCAEGEIRPPANIPRTGDGVNPGKD
jgi:hypothetical protein